jgi:hypothetical protein
VVELRDLITSNQAGYDPALQPRDRTRAQSEEQIRRIVKEFDPERLGYAAEADRGAPIVGDDRMVESGNGRMMALREIYAEHPEKAQAYKDFLASLGIDADRYDQPVLVRQRLTPLTPGQRVDFALNANKPIALGLGPGGARRPGCAPAHRRDPRPDPQLQQPRGGGQPRIHGALSRQTDAGRARHAARRQRRPQPGRPGPRPQRAGRRRLWRQSGA